MSKLFKKPAIGRVRLKMSTSNARQVLTGMGPALADKLSAFLGGVKVSPLITSCQAKPGLHRLLFDVPPGTKLPKGVDTLPFKNSEDVVRVTTFPLEAISPKLANIATPFWPFFEEALITSEGEVLLSFSSEQAKNIRFVAQHRGVDVHESGDGQAEAVCLVAFRSRKAVKPKQKRRPTKKKVSRVLRSAKPKPAPKQADGLNPESLRLLAWHVLMTLPKEEMLSIISSAIETLSSGERTELLKELATLDGLKLVQSKAKAKPSSGIRVEKASLN